MKKGTKGLLIFCLLLVLAGSGCVLTGFLMGISKEEIEQAVEKYGIFIDFDKEMIKIKENVILFPGASEKMTEKKGLYSIDSSKVREISFAISGFDCNIYNGDSDQYEVDLSANGKDKPDIEVTLEDGCLEIEHAESILGNVKSIGKTIDVYLPVGCTVEKVEISAGAGTVNIDGDMKADEISIEAGASDIKGSGTIKAETLDIELGAGSVKLDKIDVKEISVENGAGQTVLGLAGEEKDYNVTIESAAGRVVYGERIIEGLVDTYEFESESGERSIQIESAVGEVMIIFEEENK